MFLLEIPVIISQGVSKNPVSAGRPDLCEACQHRLILHTIQGDFQPAAFTDLTVCLHQVIVFFHGGKGLLINSLPMFPLCR